jgi:aspartyl-tRNA(Asn)/glutamyl-tRNA(Gln) amidotransferase subunit C
MSVPEGYEQTGALTTDRYTGDRSMKGAKMSGRKIDDATMDNVEILAKLALSPDERKKAMDEMEKILDYVEKLNELDTNQAEPLVHILSETNVFREDVVTNDDGREESLANAPKSKDGQYVVPKTV